MFKCQNCGKVLKAARPDQASRATCNGCGASITVPKSFLPWRSIGNRLLKLLGLAIVCGVVVYLRPKPPRSDSTFTDQVLVEVSKKLNTTLPLQLNKGTRLDTTFPGPGNRLTYIYTLLNFPADGRQPAEIIAAIKPQLVNAYRTSTDMALFRERQVEMCCQYKDINGNFIVSFTVSSKDF